MYRIHIQESRRRVYVHSLTTGHIQKTILCVQISAPSMYFPMCILQHSVHCFFARMYYGHDFRKMTMVLFWFALVLLKLAPAFAGWLYFVSFSFRFHLCETFSSKTNTIIRPSYDTRVDLARHHWLHRCYRRRKFHSYL